MNSNKYVKNLQARLSIDEKMTVLGKNLEKINNELDGRKLTCTYVKKHIKYALFDDVKEMISALCRT